MSGRLQQHYKPARSAVMLLFSSILRIPMLWPSRCNDPRTNCATGCGARAGSREKFSGAVHDGPCAFYTRCTRAQRRGIRQKRRHPFDVP
jgi:hypothetical protein